MGELTGFT